MADYTRPVWTEPTFYDAAGGAFTYGDRWGGQSPPEDSYSHDSHPERFAPLHAVADALVEHLMRSYDVTAETGSAGRDDFVHGYHDIARTVRLVPARADSAPLTFGWTAYPGVVVHAGVLHDFPFPHCGCDACDETATAQAQELEELVLAVTSGHYGEAVRGHLSPWLDSALSAPDGSWSRSSSGRVPAALDRDRLAAGRRRLRSLPGPWRPWPSRGGFCSGR